MRFRIPSAGKAYGGESFKIFSPAAHVRGYLNYAKREDVLDASKNYLVDGNLTVEVDIQVMLDKPLVWTPTNTLSLDMLKLLDAADNAVDADKTIPAVVTFKVASGDDTECFHAHSQILVARCPTLASLAEGCGPNAPIPIENVQVGVFRMLLRFIYGGEIPSKEVINDQGKAIIDAANRFECTGLKLIVEVELSIACITTENVAELVLFADSHTCAMLKEAAMEFFLKNKEAVMASEGFSQVKKSSDVLTELLAMPTDSKKRPASSDAASGGDYKRMPVSTLRQKLDDKGLYVDGSKEVLVSRLEVAESEARAQFPQSLAHMIPWRVPLGCRRTSDGVIVASDAGDARLGSSEDRVTTAPSCHKDAHASSLHLADLVSAVILAIICVCLLNIL